MKVKSKVFIEKNVLEKLYLEDLKSAKAISEYLGCSENKVNYWITKFNLKKRSISDALYVKWNPQGNPFVSPCAIKDEDKFMYGLGLGLFWGEGFRRCKNSVRLGNTNPRLIRAFMVFLERIFKVDRKKLKFSLQIFNDISPEASRRYWIKELDISESQIYPKISVSISNKNGSYKNKIENGVMTLYFNNTRLKTVIDSCIENIPKMY